VSDRPCERGRDVLVQADALELGLLGKLGVQALRDAEQETGR
jgi:hypothetical protein